ncbi:iron-sulfur cluster co-chaperone protein HscB-like [Actinia tenebrosa]|uniref:Iron-sulfur cluster co-chaperone protein HscB-like n=1 Tax=Actinia tenebrosa TaxID=6105 RepID=A0A6P8H7J9_ACTTE|nr:iron-sulfur cluster co-chaperone protein HscB-like [Actinia tenebrosa]
MAARVVATLCRQCLSLSPRVLARRTITRLPLSQQRPILGYVRLFGGCTKECCAENPPRCWKCDAELSTCGHSKFFCRECEVIQAPEKDATYFELFSSPETFDINTTQLSDVYRQLQFKLHPDRFSKCTQEEQNLSAIQSSLVNKAYNTLLNPLKRGIYLLSIHGISIEEEDSLSSQEFLMEIMEINERLESAAKLQTLQDIETEIKLCIKKSTDEVAHAFDEGNYIAAKDALIKLRYYTNIEKQAKDRKMSMELSGEH